MGHRDSSRKEFIVETSRVSEPKTTYYTRRTQLSASGNIPASRPQGTVFTLVLVSGEDKLLLEKRGDIKWANLELEIGYMETRHFIQFYSIPHHIG